MTTVASPVRWKKVIKGWMPLGDLYFMFLALLWHFWIRNWTINGFIPCIRSSSGSRNFGEGGPRNMIYKPLHLAAIFFGLFLLGRGGAWPPCPPPGSATDQITQIVVQSFCWGLRTSWHVYHVYYISHVSLSEPIGDYGAVSIMVINAGIVI